MLGSIFLLNGCYMSLNAQMGINTGNPQVTFHTDRSKVIGTSSS